MARQLSRVLSGAVGVGLVGYAAAVGLAKGRSPAVVSEADVEELIDRRLGSFGAAGRHLHVGTTQGRIHVLDVGVGESPVVLLHGLGGSAGSYPGLIAGLAEHRRVVAIDLPGAGLSDQVRFQGHPRAAWNEVIGQVADQLELGPFHLCGHSMGGLAAGGFAVSNPARILGLVLLAPVGLAPNPPLGWRAAVIPGLPELVFALDQWTMSRQQRSGARDIRGLRWGPVEVGPDPDGYRHLVGERFTSGSDLTAFVRLLSPTGFRSDSLLLPALGLLSGRTQVVFGDQDRKVPLSPAQQQLANYPGLELAVRPGWGHLFPFLQPQETAQLVESWLVAHEAEPVRGVGESVAGADRG